MTGIKWVKITTDMFDNRKIKHLRKLPDGNNIVLIWVMLLTMAGRCNAGGMIFLTENIPYTPKMLADELGFEENTVKLALQALEQLNMVTTDQGHFAIAGWEEYQNIDGMDKIRAQTNKRVAAYRQRQKLLAESAEPESGEPENAETGNAEPENSEPADAEPDNATCNAACNATRNVTATPRNATDKEEDIDKDKEKIYCPVIAYLNERAGTQYKASSRKTKALIRARVNEGFTLEDFKTVIDRKCADWLSDAKMQEYIRPSTLFGTKFEEYLNAGRKAAGHDGKHQDEIRTMAQQVGTYF